MISSPRSISMDSGIYCVDEPKRKKNRKKNGSSEGKHENEIIEIDKETESKEMFHSFFTQVETTLSENESKKKKKKKRHKNMDEAYDLNSPIKRSESEPSPASARKKKKQYKNMDEWDINPIDSLLSPRKKSQSITSLISARPLNVCFSTQHNPSKSEHSGSKHKKNSSNNIHPVTNELSFESPDSQHENQRRRRKVNSSQTLDENEVPFDLRTDGKEKHKDICGEISLQSKSQDKSRSTIDNLSSKDLLRSKSMYETLSIEEVTIDSNNKSKKKRRKLQTESNVLFEESDTAASVTLIESVRSTPKKIKQHETKGVSVDEGMFKGSEVSSVVNLSSESLKSERKKKKRNAANNSLSKDVATDMSVVADHGKDTKECKLKKSFTTTCASFASDPQNDQGESCDNTTINTEKQKSTKIKKSHRPTELCVLTEESDAAASVTVVESVRSTPKKRKQHETKDVSVDEGMFNGSDVSSVVNLSSESLRSEGKKKKRNAANNSLSKDVTTDTPVVADRGKDAKECKLKKSFTTTCASFASDPQNDQGELCDNTTINTEKQKSKKLKNLHRPTEFCELAEESNAAASVTLIESVRSTPKKRKQHETKDVSVDEGMFNGSEVSSVVNLSSESLRSERKKKKRNAANNSLSKDVAMDMPIIADCGKDTRSAPCSFDPQNDHGKLCDNTNMGTEKDITLKQMSKQNINGKSTVKKTLKRPSEASNEKDSHLFSRWDEEGGECTEELENLKLLQIMLHHEVPDSHLVEQRVTRPPSAEERAILAALPISLKTTRYNSSEDAIIKDNWKKFCEEYNIKSAGVLLSKRRKGLKADERRALTQYLGNGLPNRTLSSIYNRFLHLCSHRNKGPYTEDEDNIIMNYMANQQHNKPFHYLASVLQRDNQSVNERYARLMKNQTENSPRMQCDLHLAEKIVKALMDVMQFPSPDKLESYHVSTHVWKEVGARLNVPYEKLRHYWNCRISVQLFAHEPICENKIFRLISKWLRHQKYQHQCDVEWQVCAQRMPGANARFMWEMFRRLRAKYPELKDKAFPDEVEALYLKRKACRKEQKITMERLRAGPDGTLSRVVADFVQTVISDVEGDESLSLV